MKFKCVARQPMPESEDVLFLFQPHDERSSAVHTINIEHKPETNETLITLEYEITVTEESGAVTKIMWLMSKTNDTFRSAKILQPTENTLVVPTFTEIKKKQMEEEVKEAFTTMLENGSVQQTIKMFEQKKRNPEFNFIRTSYPSECIEQSPHPATSTIARSTATRERLRERLVSQSTPRRYVTPRHKNESNENVYDIHVLNDHISGFSGHIWFEEKKSRTLAQIAICGDLSPNKEKVIILSDRTILDKEECEYVQNIMLNAFHAMKALIQIENIKCKAQSTAIATKDAELKPKQLSPEEAAELAKQLEGSQSKKQRPKNTNEKDSIDAVIKLKNKISDFLKKEVKISVSYLKNLQNAKQKLNTKKANEIRVVVNTISDFIGELQQFDLSTITSKTYKNKAITLKKELTTKTDELHKEKNTIEILMHELTAASVTSAIAEPEKPETPETTQAVTASSTPSENHSTLMITVGLFSSPSTEVLGAGEVSIPTNLPPLTLEGSRWADELPDDNSVPEESGDFIATSTLPIPTAPTPL